MMRRCLLLCVALFLLTSCSGGEPESHFPVTAAALDSVDGGVSLTLEVMIGTNEGGKSEMRSTCLIGFGDNFSSALVDAAHSVGRDITFDHMALAILGEGLDQTSLADAIAFCAALEGVTPALSFVCAENGSALLTEAADGRTPLAYEITSALQSEASSAYTSGCRLADIVDRRLNGRRWAIPYFTAEVEAQNQKQVKRIGLTVFDGDCRLETLTGEAVPVWRMLENYSIKGNLYFGEAYWKATGARIADGTLTLCLRSGDSDRAKRAIGQALERFAASYPDLMTNEVDDITSFEIEVVRFLW